MHERNILSWTKFGFEYEDETDEQHDLFAIISDNLSAFVIQTTSR